MYNYLYFAVHYGEDLQHRPANRMVEMISERISVNCDEWTLVDDCLSANTKPDIYRQTSLVGGSASFQNNRLCENGCSSIVFGMRSQPNTGGTGFCCLLSYSHWGNEDTCTTWGATIFQKFVSSKCWSNVINENWLLRVPSFYVIF